MKFKIILFFLVLVSTSQSCRNKRDIDDMNNKIKEVLAGTEGVFAIAFKDLTNGETIFINEKERFHAASTMKTPVLIELYKQAAAGKFNLTDSIEVKNEFKSIVDGSTYSLSPTDDSEAGLYSIIGAKSTIADLAYKMIISSSNLATNIIIELVDAKSVTQTMRTLGASEIEILRGVEDQKAYDQGLSNTTNAYDLMILFEALAAGKAVSQEADNEMIRILLDQKFNEIIPAQLPKDVKVAHKTGSITGVQHDSGIIMLPNGKKYVLVLLSKELTDPNAGIKAMATVSSLVYNHFIESHQK